MKILLTSANLGGIDTPNLHHEAQRVPAGTEIDFKYYNDKSLILRSNALHPRLQAKIPKMLSHEIHPGYDYYIWIDSSIFLSHQQAIMWLLNKMNSMEIVFFKHPYRKSIKSELDFCLSEMANGNRYLLNRYSNEPMKEQVNLYLSDKNFKDEKLFSCGIFCYSSKLIEKHPNFLREWYYECARWSVQDQLSLPWLLSKHEVNYACIDEDIYKNQFFKMKQHNR